MGAFSFSSWITIGPMEVASLTFGAAVFIAASQAGVSDWADVARGRANASAPTNARLFMVSFFLGDVLRFFFRRLHRRGRWGGLGSGRRRRSLGPGFRTQDFPHHRQLHLRGGVDLVELERAVVGAACELRVDVAQVLL